MYCHTFWRNGRGGFTQAGALRCAQWLLDTRCVKGRLLLNTCGHDAGGCEAQCHDHIPGTPGRRAGESWGRGCGDECGLRSQGLHHSARFNTCVGLAKQWLQEAWQGSLLATAQGTYPTAVHGTCGGTAQLGDAVATVLSFAGCMHAN